MPRDATRYQLFFMNNLRQTRHRDYDYFLYYLLVLVLGWNTLGVSLCFSTFLVVRLKLFVSLAKIQLGSRIVIFSFVDIYAERMEQYNIGCIFYLFLRILFFHVILSRSQPEKIYAGLSGFLFSVSNSFGFGIYSLSETIGTIIDRLTACAIPFPAPTCRLQYPPHKTS